MFPLSDAPGFSCGGIVSDTGAEESHRAFSPVRRGPGPEWRCKRSVVIQPNLAKQNQMAQPTLSYPIAQIVSSDPGAESRIFVGETFERSLGVSSAVESNRRAMSAGAWRTGSRCGSALSY